MSVRDFHRPILVQMLYGAALLAVVVPVAAAVAVVAIVYFWQPDTTYGFYIAPSSVLFAVWAGVILLALGTWFWRRYGVRR